MLDQNPIYDFMKSNKLTDLDEKSFLNKYSAPDKAKEIHSFFAENALTDLDSDNFYDKYLKKKDQKAEVLPSAFSPSKSQLVLPDFEKGRAFAEKGFLMQAEGTKAPKPEKRISFEPSFNIAAPFEVKVLEEGEEPSLAADLMIAGARGQIQGKVANLLPAGKVPTNEELGEIAQLQTDAKLLPQSKAEKAYQEKGLKGLFTENPLLGAQFVGETMLSSLASLAQASSRTLPTAIAAGAGAGAAFAGIGALPGAAMGLLAGQSAAGYNLSTSQDILNSLSENGVDVSNKESLIKAFSDENKMAKIRTTAAKYGVPILLFDAATAGLAGKLGAGAIGKGLSKKLLAGLGEAGIQMTGGAGGELAGQIASGKKVNWDDVAVEAIAEVPGGAVEVATGIALERSKTSSNNNTLATQIATQGPEDGTKDAVLNLNRDLANNVITLEQHQEGMAFVEKASQVSSKIPETVTGESKAKSIELLVERNDIKEGNQILEQQKQATDEAYHAGIDEEIKANEEKIKKIDSEVYNIAKNPIPVKEKPVVKISEQEIIEPEPTKVLPIEEVTVTEEVKPTEVESKQTEVVESGNDLILSHGTRHDFDKFQLEKIGTGEGAQAFGYGLYFTDGSKIAEGYAKKLSEDNTGLVYSVKIKNGKLANWAEWRRPLDESIESSFYDKLTKEEKAQYQDYVDDQFNSGKDKNYTGSFGDLELSKEGFLEYPTFEKPSASGNLYQDLKAAFGQEKATEIFKRAGIDGIKYESQGGYGNENNYVVFNPESIEVIKKSKGGAEVKPTEVKTEEEPQAVTKEEETNKQLAETELLLSGEAEKRRKEGKFTKDGIEYNRNEKQKGEVGNNGEVRFTNDVSLPFKYKLVEAETIQPSHENGIRNPLHFVPEAQPKNRNDIGSLQAEESFANNPRFDELGENTNAYSGSPVVNERGEVIQGNNRSAGLRKGYKRGNIKYKTDLANNAEKFGFTKEQVEGMSNPVLVREIAVSDVGAIELGNYDVKDLETGGKRRLDPVSITRRMPFELKGRISEVLFKGDDTLNKSLRDNSKKILELISPYLNQSQRNTLFKDGTLTESGAKDLEAVVQHFLFDGGDVALPDLFESLSYTQKEGLRKSLPSIFSTSSEKSITPQIQEAIIAINSFNESGINNFDTWLGQTDMFNDGKTPNDTFSPTAIAIAKVLNIGSQKEIVAEFAKYADAVKDKPATMFEGATEGVSKKDAIKQIFKTEYDETAEQQKAIGSRSSKEAIGEQETIEEAKPKSKSKPKPKPTESQAVKDYKEAVKKAGKKARENAKNEFVDRNFDKIIEKLKIEIKCPT